MTNNIEVKCVIFDPKQDTYSVLLKYEHGFNRTSKIEIPLSDLTSKGLASILSDKMGPEYEGDFSQLAKSLRDDAKASPEKVRASRFGLQDDGRTLVSTSRVFRKGAKIASYIKPNCLAEHYGRRGNTNQWRTISEYMKLSSPLTFGICAAFAAPIMRLTDLRSRAFVFSGETRGGKSTAIRAAASVAGHKPDAELPTFNFTEAGSTELFESYNGILLPLDDLELQDGTAKVKHENVHRFAYLYSDGQSKKKSKYAIEAGNASHATWRSLSLLGAENGPDVLAKKAGELRQPGAAQRLILIPVGDHIFDFDDSDNVDVIKHCTAITKIIELNFGCPLDNFLRKFSLNLKESKAAFAFYLSEVRKALLKERAIDKIRSVADYFALVGAAGMMACDFGILDVDHKHIKRSIKRCFVRASKHIDAERYEITRGIKRLQLFVEQAPRVSKGDNVRSDCKGFVRINKGNSVLVISRQHFIGLYEGRLQARLVAKHLSLAGDIAAEAPEPLPVSLDWAEEQVNWPFKTGSKRVRSICIAINN